MNTISTEIIKKAVYKLCYNANICLSSKVYYKILNAYNSVTDKELKMVYASILQNAKMAFETQRPLCQDTGQVLVFLTVGQEVQLTGKSIEEVVNEAIESCYADNFFRKSVVRDGLLERTNTKTNTPAIIYTEIVKGNEVKIEVLIKGAGSENKSKAAMLLPTSSKEEIKKYIADCVLESGTSSCPPLFIGVGVGGTFDRASILAKKALLIDASENEELNSFAEEIKDYINENAPKEFNQAYVLDLNIITAQTHIACLPVSVCINCHSSREAACIIKNGEINYLNEVPDFIELKEDNFSILPEVNTAEVEKIRNLKKGDHIFLTGEVFVARDAAHLRLIELIKKNEKLPIELKDKIILYAGPCPSKSGEIIGPIGPTTSSRMDKFAPLLYEMGLLATIGKGERNKEVYDSVQKNSAVYFALTGGIASLIASKVRSSEIIAFEDLGAEAIYKLQVEKLPVKVNISKEG